MRCLASNKSGWLVADRVAREVARRYLEPIVEPLFHSEVWRANPQLERLCSGIEALMILRSAGAFRCVDAERLRASRDQHQARRQEHDQNDAPERRIVHIAKRENAER